MGSLCCDEEGEEGKMGEEDGTSGMVKSRGKVQFILPLVDVDQADDNSG